MSDYPKNTKEDAEKFAKSLLTGVNLQYALEYAGEMLAKNKRDTKLSKFYSNVISALKGSALTSMRERGITQTQIRRLP